MYTCSSIGFKQLFLYCFGQLKRCARSPAQRTVFICCGYLPMCSAHVFFVINNTATVYLVCLLTRLCQMDRLRKRSLSPSSIS